MTERRLSSFREWYHVASIPLLATFALDKKYLHPSYRMTWWRRVKLVHRLWRNTRRIQTGVSYKAHVAMAAKLLQMPPDQPGIIVECGCWQGGTSANLSLLARLVGRAMVVYDSFEGLPSPTPGDRHAKPESQGFFRGDIDTVRTNIARHGAPEVVSLRPGWFTDTLPLHTEPIAFMFLDVDYQASLHDCVVNLWPYLSDKGYVFLDEFVLLDYCGLFWSESFWERHFGTTPPGLMGSGTGVGVGQFYLGPFDWKVDPTSVAYTRKDFSGYWGFDPEPRSDPN